jgi:biopolymer transport protein ExbB/TolQ
LARLNQKCISVTFQPSQHLIGEKGDDAMGMDALILLIPGLLTGFAALIAALAALFKRSDTTTKNTELHNDAVDVIEKMVDGQSAVNQMLLARIQRQDDIIDELQKERTNHFKKQRVQEEIESLRKKERGHDQ